MVFLFSNTITVLYFFMVRQKFHKTPIMVFLFSKTITVFILTAAPLILCTYAVG
jgi:hypothetical protein